MFTKSNILAFICAFFIGFGVTYYVNTSKTTTCTCPCVGCDTKCICTPDCCDDPNCCKGKCDKAKKGCCGDKECCK